METVCTPEGPRQRTVCYLSELNSSAQSRWLTVEVFNERGERRQLNLFSFDVEPPGNDPEVRDEVEAKRVPMPTGTETDVLCRSRARREKERAIRRRFSIRMERALKRLTEQVKQGHVKDRSKVERRLGRIQARNAQVADLYEMNLTERDGRPVLNWNPIKDRRACREAREGAYLLRTNLEGETAEELWTKCIQLTEAEASFRALKSELSVRPLFHQIEPRVKEHIGVAFLGYALWVR